jgi:protein-S-isoprenylcysteine O-methyltransferase Ste14
MKNVKMAIMATVLTLAAVGQIILAFILYNKDGNVGIINLGWVILWISAIFGWLPIFTFKKWGGVSKGKGYIHTTVLVNRGVYAIVRHPQYLAGMLMGLALPLISQHWAVALPGIVAVIAYYINTFDEEVSAIAKFGEAYKEYMQRVPRVNFLLGILRLIEQKLFLSS